MKCLIQVLLGNQLKKENVSINCLDIRKNSNNKHNQIDAKPYGGGEGMLMMAEPLAKTIKEIDEDKKRYSYKLFTTGKDL